MAVWVNLAGINYMDLMILAKNDIKEFESIGDVKSNNSMNQSKQSIVSLPIISNINSIFPKILNFTNMYLQQIN